MWKEEVELFPLLGYIEKEVGTKYIDSVPKLVLW